MTQTLYIDYHNKKIPVVISACHEKEYRAAGGIHVFCEQANLDQDYMLQDLEGLLQTLPELIDFQKSHKKEEVIKLRLSPAEKIAISKMASKKGYKSISSYMRSVALAK